MTDRDEGFRRRILAKRQAIADRLSSNSLRVAVLGPNLDATDGVGTRKRQQIKEALENDGHETFYPEEYVHRDDPLWIEQERKLLSDDKVDFIIALDTVGSTGVMMEIANFVSVPDISAKTGILAPFEFYKPKENMFGNTVQAYPTKLQYTKEDFESCQLVAECKRWADTRQRDMWLELSPERF